MPLKVNTEQTVRQTVPSQRNISQTLKTVDQGNVLENAHMNHSVI